MFASFFWISLLGGLATSFSLTDPQPLLKSFGGGTLIKWEPRTLISSQQFPCTEEGFFVHPTNCSRFYRCVDFTNESRIFSRYLFECPEGEVFADTIDTCVPGVCPETLQKPPTPDEGSTGTGTVVQPVAVDPSTPVAPGDSSGKPVETGSSSGPTGVSPDPVSPVSPVVDVPTEVKPKECIEGLYAQHKRYCNLFHLCGDEDNLFSCYEGTAFSANHQMCRLSQFDESLCVQKEVFVPSSAAFRDAFNWEDVAVVPYYENTVYNANPYVFTNIAALYKDEISEKIPRFEELTSLGEKSGLSAMMEAMKEDRHMLKNYGASLDNKKVIEKNTENKVAGETPSSINSEDFEVVAFPFASLFDKYSGSGQTQQSPTGVFSLTPFTSSGLNNKYANALQQGQFGSIGVIPFSPFSVSGSSNPFGASEISSPFRASGVSSSPFGASGISNTFGASGVSSSPFSVSGLGSSFGLSSSPFASQSLTRSPVGYGLSPSSYTPYISFSPLPFSQSGYSPYSQYSSYPTAAYSSPYLSSGSLVPYPSSRFSSQNPSPYQFSSSPIGFSLNPSNYNLIPVTLPLTFSDSSASSSAYNPYHILQLDEKQLEQLFLASQGSVPSSELGKGTKKNTRDKHPVVPLEKQAFDFHGSSQSNKAFPFNFGVPQTITDKNMLANPFLVPFEARNEEGETFHIVPLSDQDVDFMHQQGLIDRATSPIQPISYEDLKNLKEGEIILARIKK